jgi:hypothetical protein
MGFIFCGSKATILTLYRNREGLNDWVYEKANAEKK